MNTIRRDAFKMPLAGTVSVPLARGAERAASGADNKPVLQWGTGGAGQRKADLGDGTFLNPIIGGDHPDPTVLKDGDDYYMTFPSFYSYPGLVIRHSTDMVNRTPLTAALSKSLGVVWAVDPCKHGDRNFIHIPANPEEWAGRSTRSGPLRLLPRFMRGFGHDV